MIAAQAGVSHADSMNQASSSATNTQSAKLYERACQVIPAGVNSPVRAFRSVGGTPIFMRSGQAQFLEDADGNQYLDFCSSWGPLISGHRHPAIMEAIRAQIDNALTFGTPCEEEVLLAEFVIERLRPLVPTAEKIRFVNSGTEAVMSALRLARGFTGRGKVIKFEGCYHGHVDSLLVKAGSGLATFGTPDSAGVPAPFTGETIVVALDDEDGLRKAFADHGGDIAALILEPVPANNGLLLQRPEFLQLCRDLTSEHGALLIFDEVISGFRADFGGAAGFYKIAPDLMTYGKIIGGGMPVGAFAGRADVFAQLAPDGPVYQAGTLSGNPVAMSAGLAALRLLDADAYAHLETLGRHLEQRWAAANIPLGITRCHSIFWMYAGSEPPRRADAIDRDSMQTYAKLHAFLLERGLYLAPSGYEVGFLSLPMTTADVDRLVDTVSAFFAGDGA